MQLLSLNLWKNDGDFPQRLGLVRDGLLALKPDIVCLQEVYQDALLNVLDEVAPETLSARVFAPARPKPRGGVMSYSGLAILSTYPITDHAIIDLPTSDKDGGRVALRANVATPLGAIRVLNLHLSHLRCAEGVKLRAQQGQAALSWASNDWDGPLIICGDLNCPMAEDWFKRLFGTDETHQSTAFLGGQSSLRDLSDTLIDHIILFGRGALKLTECRLCFNDGPLASDHCGLLAQITDKLPSD